MAERGGKKLPLQCVGGRGGEGGGGGNFTGVIFLPGEGNLRRSDFDDSNLFQS